MTNRRACRLPAIFAVLLSAAVLALSPPAAALEQAPSPTRAAGEVYVYFPDGAPGTLSQDGRNAEVTADAPISSSAAVLVFPQLKSVSVRKWVPKDPTAPACQKYPVTGIFEDYSARSETSDAPPKVRMPELQYHVAYCYAIQGRGEGNSRFAGVLFAREPWPLGKKSADWWAERYILPSVGIGIAGWQAPVRPDGVNAVANPYVFVGVHVTPFPTDRRFMNSERVHNGFCEGLHAEVGIALTSPWQDVELNVPLGKGLVVAPGYSFGDNILGVSFGAVIGSLKYHDIDDAGVGHDHQHLLVSLTANVSIQYDIVGAILGMMSPTKAAVSQ